MKTKTWFWIIGLAIGFIVLNAIFHGLWWTSDYSVSTDKIVEPVPPVKLPSVDVKLKKPDIPCKSDIELEDNSKSLGRKIEENCQKYSLKKGVDWTRFKDGKNNGFTNVLHDNPVEIWWSNLVVSENLKAIYAKIQKTGTTQVSSALAKDAGIADTHDIHGLLNHDKMNGAVYLFGMIGSYEKAREKFDSYFKFAFFRDPLERLLSSYRNYFHSLPDREPKYEPFIGIWKKKLVDPTVKQFMEVLATLNDSSKFDHHFRPQTLIAHPCEIQYDYIAFTNDIGCSLPYVFKKLGSSNKKKVVPKRTAIHWNEEEFHDIKDLTRLVLRKHYQTDYDLLGFELPSFLRD